jgi:hypothetical protein
MGGVSQLDAHYVNLYVPGCETQPEIPTGDSAMSTNVAGVYITGLFGKSGLLVPTTKELLGSRINDYIFWSVHVHPDGSLYYNDSALAQGGKTNRDIAQPIADLIAAARKARLVSTVWFSIGAGGVSDFANIQAILRSGGKAADNLYANFQAVYALGADGFDLDYEENLTDPVGLISELTIGLNQRMGARLTYCPYYGTSFWIDCLAATYKALRTQPVIGFNLQCYSGGGGNDPRTWTQAIKAAGSLTGVNNPDTFVRPGLAVAGSASMPALTPLQMTQQLNSWGSAGGWIWNSQTVINQQGATKFAISDYATALLNAQGAKASAKAH